MTPPGEHLLGPYPQMVQPLPGWAIRARPVRSILNRTNSPTPPTLDSFSAFSSARITSPRNAVRDIYDLRSFAEKSDPFPTYLSSFADDADTVATMPTDLQPMGLGYTYSPSVGAYYDINNNPVPYSQVLAATGGMMQAPIAVSPITNIMVPPFMTGTSLPGGTSPTSGRPVPAQPAAGGPSNTITDAISGIIRAFTPVASAAASRGNVRGAAQSSLTSFLQGRAPGQQLTSSGSGLGIIALVAGVILLGVVATRK